MAIRVKRGNGWSFAGPDQHTTLLNDPANASEMRAFVGDFLTRAKVPEDVVDEILMAVGEVVANSCRHGRRVRGKGQVVLHCVLVDANIVVTITDDGPGFDSEHVLKARVPDVLSQGGRGFFLMDQLMDRVEVASSHRGTTVVLERALAR